VSIIIAGLIVIFAILTLSRWLVLLSLICAIFAGIHNTDHPDTRSEISTAATTE
jgi:hypothetical protein